MEQQKFDRVFRDRMLTPEEIARDLEVRRKVRDEFPPLISGAMPRSDTLSEAVRNAIRESGRSVDEIAMEVGVSPIAISRFLSGERDLRMATADRLAETLGLHLVAGPMESG